MNFDAHSDIWTDVTQHHLKGERDPDVDYFGRRAGG